jgi:hypothetical protein
MVATSGCACTRRCTLLLVLRASRDVPPGVLRACICARNVGVSSSDPRSPVPKLTLLSLVASSSSSCSMARPPAVVPLRGLLRGLRLPDLVGELAALLAQLLAALPAQLLTMSAQEESEGCLLITSRAHCCTLTVRVERTLTPPGPWLVCMAVVAVVAS